MAIHEIFMPALSSTMTEGRIVKWLKQPGDRVERGESVLVVESDKADMDVESFNDGILANVLMPAGSMAPVGETIALIAETEAEVGQAQTRAGGSAAAATASAPAPSPATTSTAPATTSTAVATPSPPATATPPAAAAPPPPSAPPASVPSAPGQADGRLVATPRARKLAKQLGVAIETLRGSGPHGRVVAEDVERAAGTSPSTPRVSEGDGRGLAVPSAKTAPAQASAPSLAAAAPGETVAFSTLQDAVNRNMLASLAAPTFSVGYTITTDGLDGFYRQVKSKGVTMTALLAKAVALTLMKHPQVNTAATDTGMRFAPGINIAVAVAMDDGGLLTPVLAAADSTDLYALSRNWADLVKRARNKQLAPEEYSSGSFTLSNLGMFGVDRFDAILPPGTGAILAVGASRPVVAANADGSIAVRRQMQVNLTADHRVIYGAHAAAFLRDLADLIENHPTGLAL